MNICLNKLLLSLILPTEDREAAGVDRWALPGVRQESSTLQQLDGGSYGRPAGHVHCPQYWGDSGNCKLGSVIQTGASHDTNHESKCGQQYFWGPANERLFLQTRHAIVQRGIKYCCLGKVIPNMFLLRVWSQHMSSSSPPWRRPIRSERPSSPSRLRCRRSPKATASSWAEQTPTPPSHLRASTANGKR